jgi:hypothetical protein
MRTIAVKSEGQQMIPSLHRVRSLLAKFGMMQVNELRELLCEFGATSWVERLAAQAEIRKRMAE